MVSYLGGHAPHVLLLPTVERQLAGRGTSTKRGSNRRAATALPTGVSFSESEDRMLELIQQQHPTAHMLRLSGKDIWDKDNAPRFNHTDRTEECWCGKAHNSNNYAAWFAEGQAYVHAFGCQRTFKIGSLAEDFSAAGDAEVSCWYLARLADQPWIHWPEQLEGGQLTMKRAYVTTFGLKKTFNMGRAANEFIAATNVEPDLKVRNRCRACQPCHPALWAGGELARHRTWTGPIPLPEGVPWWMTHAQARTVIAVTMQLNTARFDAEVDKLMDKPTDKRTLVLGIQSCMGSGKTHVLKTLIQELQDRYGELRVLLVVYRQSLSHSLLSELEALGFVK
jgi:hypothetical protein